MFKLNKIIVLFFILNFNKIILSEGFSPGTHVMSPLGSIPIELLKKGDIICSYDFEKSEIVDDEVISNNYYYATEASCFTIDYNHIDIICSPNQKFYGMKYDIDNKKEYFDWFETKNIDLPNKLFSFAEVNNFHWIYKMDNLKASKAIPLFKITTKNNNIIICKEDRTNDININAIANSNISVNASNNSDSTTNINGRINVPYELKLSSERDTQSFSNELFEKVKTSNELLKKVISSFSENQSQKNDLTQSNKEQGIEAKSENEEILKEECIKKINELLPNVTELVNNVTEVFNKDKTLRKKRALKNKAIIAKLSEFSDKDKNQ